MQLDISLDAQGRAVLTDRNTGKTEVVETSVVDRAKKVALDTASREDIPSFHWDALPA